MAKCAPLLAVAFGCVGVALLAGCRTDAYLAGRSEDLAAQKWAPTSDADAGRARFLFDDLNGLSTQTLNTNAFPWKVVTTALLLERTGRAPVPEDLAKLPAIFAEFGFLTPTDVANWPAGEPQPRFRHPMGLTTGTVRSRPLGFQLEVANLTCAACHAGVTYAADGTPRPSVWLGLPNTSIDFQAFGRSVAVSLTDAMGDPQAFLRAIGQLYPDTPRLELRTISVRVLPALQRRLADSRAYPPGYPLGFDAGSSGLINGLSATKRMFGVLPADSIATDRGLVSVPDLAGLKMRSAAFWDGGYAPAGQERFEPRTADAADARHFHELAPIMNAVTTPVMGIRPDIAVKALPRVEQIAAFLQGYTPPRYPGSVDRNRAERGAALFALRCSRCHGAYGGTIDDVHLVSFPNRLIATDRIGTDPLRASLVSDALVASFASSPFAGRVSAARTGGYVAPPLSGLWATAPYLHNGSVPTLWHLMHPQARPQRFLVGGHCLDMERVGVANVVGSDGEPAYPSTCRAWAKPTLYDTRERGQSNAGHEAPFAQLSEAEKGDLLEFLKLL